MELNEIREKIGTFNWYHAIQFSDDILTPGRFSSKIPPNYTIFPVFYFLENMDLNGIDCIDIGAVDGLVSFIVKQEGGNRVVATDRGNRDEFRFAREALDLDVDYIPGSTYVFHPI